MEPNEHGALAWIGCKHQNVCTICGLDDDRGKPEGDAESNQRFFRREYAWTGETRSSSLNVIFMSLL